MAEWSPLFYSEPLEVVSGRGREVVAGDGRTYLDFYGGVAVNLLGYGDHELEEAVRAQLSSGVVHCSTFYLHRRQVELAELIAARSGIDDPAVFFTCSGSEAVEAALLAVREYRKAERVVALEGSYHGRTLGALSVTGQRGWHGRVDAPLPVTFLSEGQDAREVVGPDVAALIAEPVQGVAGAVPLAPGRLRECQEALSAADVPLIVDEVQTGWGRTGRWWGYQWHGVRPDVIVFAKGVGGGLTIGGVVGRRAILDALPMPSISTFGGGPLSAAAALCVVRAVESRGLVKRAGRLGRLIAHGVRRGGRVRVQGQGLLLGVTCHDEAGRPDAPFAASVHEECRARGLLVGLGGTHGNCLRLMPPLTLTEEEARRGTEALVASVAAVG
ncbi:aspartate aminotransferase family protein [Streptomyces sp. SID14478]|uniref:aspartate aminotransferase family protein n=1 Tax=Streptomyces sp. SID14478 TaxID=2706073 RepID=UPI0019413A8D|nr:aspartate aminotransferase family protein [Streptomyces sp. SID14478]